MNIQDLEKYVLLSYGKLCFLEIKEDLIELLKEHEIELSYGGCFESYDNVILIVIELRKNGLTVGVDLRAELQNPKCMLREFKEDYGYQIFLKRIKEQNISLKRIKEQNKKNKNN